ncbi:tetratricopeptide repeat protein [Streptomyces soliscabiei]|uniref:tetratricopeptide repeat protein n=1 Tax=Streptomyces soliscabiei TaxID=588897 RepID=UPI0029BC5BBF|nr:tetratricopeptide repeat protein [Streptomyces sp. NY05-11A]MDX2675841.1 tetratricopeptide repeat protein [Streptomyces sp. NY05-11A]
MSRLSREKKREQKHAARPAAVVAPLDVHVRGGGTATIGGVPVAAVDGEEIQRAVLSHLHRIALATGHPVLATVHDERIGYVVPLRVDPDGSSHFTAEPLRTTAAPTPGAVREPAPVREAAPDAQITDPAPAAAPAPVGDEQPARPRSDKATHLLRQVPEPVRDAAPTFPLRAIPESATEQGPQSAPVPDSAPTYAIRAIPEPQDDTPAPGTVTAPTGVFGPPPTMDDQPHNEQPNPDADPTSPPISISTPTPTPTSTPAPPSTPPLTSPSPSPLASAPAPILSPTPLLASAPIPLPLPVPASPPVSPAPTPLLPDDLVSDSVFDPDSKPTPARGFDAVAEAVLGDDPRTLQGDGGGPALLGEQMARVNEAVREGRIDAAAALAEQTVLEASGTLGPEHPEVLRLRELGAYIAYLAGDPLRAFHVSLDLARIRRSARDGEAAYGNVQSAAAAWRAVRDPVQGLNLGTELLGLWTELTAEEGPAAEDVEQLESARARMLRLAERARRSGA